LRNTFLNTTYTMISVPRENNDVSSPICINSKAENNRTRFSTIEVREFNRTLGDNPACRDGPPMTLDWDFVDKESISIDEYEANRLPRRSHRHLFLSMFVRRSIMRNQFGFTLEDLEKVERSVRLAQKKRQKTKNSSIMKEKTQLFAESARNIISSPFRTNLQWANRPPRA